ncbi:hypothetical protein V1520DRAFT_341159 [Lipomyces starkeyi]|uniref:BTB domain-containing protein n=1 Tax=Lipomyces starkeyi NRRL Y-11557 TaxID=675824 RepID=A0A1E3PYN0_LIPST|nr:hypothetical protein LIPSTDRAFT_65547 [Lipomyces starkeyi NRRL Y-11557]
MSSQSPHNINHAPVSSAPPVTQPLPLPRVENGSQSLPPPIPAQYTLQPLPPMIADLQGRPPPSAAGSFHPQSGAPPTMSIGGRMVSPHLHSMPMPLAENAGPLPASFHPMPSGYSPSIVPNGRSGMMAYVGGASNGAHSPASSNGGPSVDSRRPRHVAQPEPIRNGADTAHDLASGLKGLYVTPAQSASQASAGDAAESSVVASTQDLQPYIYNIGFIHAAWTDTFLSIPPHTTLRLHALMISRSPTLYRFLLPLAAQGPPYHIQINDADPNLSTAAISMTLATLYGQPLVIESPTLVIAKGLIAAGHLFGLEDVVKTGYAALQSLISMESLPELFAFAFEGLPSTRSAPSSTGSTPSGDEIQRDNIVVTYPGPYPKYTETLLPSLVAYLIDNIDHEFILKPNGNNPPRSLRSLLLSLPFHLFKHVCESENLKCKSQMERYGFARDLIGERERRRRKTGGGSFEEGVVLAFGGGKGGVEVIRKPTGKKKVLWKASQ